MKERFGRGVPLNFTNEQMAFIKKHCTSYTRKELLAVMIKEFSDLNPRFKNASTFAQKMRRLGMPCKKLYGCPKGLPVGAIRKAADGSAGRIKISHNPVIWQPLHRYVWEQHNGRKLKKSEIVRFLDGDNTNYEADNLFAVTKAANSRINAENKADTPCPKLNKMIMLSEHLKVESRQIMREKGIKYD